MLELPFIKFECSECSQINVVYINELKPNLNEMLHSYEVKMSVQSLDLFCNLFMIVLNS